jgi:hypothetical protein
MFYGHHMLLLLLLLPPPLLLLLPLLWKVLKTKLEVLLTQYAEKVTK